jgi:chromosomal replication initiation ATPase DnaA
MKIEASIIARRLSKRGYLTLARHVAEKCHVTVEDMLSRSKRKSHVIARHMLWFAIYSDGNLSYPEMAEIFERDNSTIYVAVDNMTERTIAKAMPPTATPESEVA